jgi:hypothetical protein
MAAQNVAAARQQTGGPSAQGSARLEEELPIGKREVQRRGVRVYSRKS